MSNPHFLYLGMKKLKLVKSLVIASLIVSLALVLFGIHQLINNEYLTGLAFLFGGIAMGWNDCKTIVSNRNNR